MSIPTEREPATRAPLTVVQVVAPGVVGGTESVVRGLAVGLSRQGHGSHVIGIVDPTPDEHPFLRELADVGVTVHDLRISPRGYLEERRRVRELLVGLRPDVVHVHGYRPEFIDAPVARRLGIPVITTLHGSSRVNRRTLAYEWLQTRLLRRCDGIVAVSNEIVRDMVARGVPAHLLHCIPNGWVSSTALMSRDDARVELGLERDDFVVGWVGRLIPVKGCDVFVNAFAACRGEPISGVVIGDGPQRESLVQLTAELGLGAQLRFAGSRPLAARLFSAFDMFVLSSRSEGTPVTLLEAIAANVPVVSTTVGAIPDLLSDDDAVLVPPENPSALGAAIMRCAHDRQEAVARATSAAGKLTNDLGADLWLSRHETLYRAVSSARRSTPNATR